MHLNPPDHVDDQGSNPSILGELMDKADFPNPLTDYIEPGTVTYFATNKSVTLVLSSSTKRKLTSP